MFKLSSNDEWWRPIMNNFSYKDYELQNQQHKQRKRGNLPIKSPRYWEITMDDLVKELGGLQALDQYKNEDDLHNALWQAHDNFVMKLHDSGVKEVGEIDPTTITDFVDNILYQRWKKANP